MEDNAQQGSYTSEEEGGAKITTTYLGRRLKAYAVYETEMDTLSSLNEQSTTFTAAAWALVSFAVGIWTTAIFTDKLSPTANVAAFMGGPILLFLAALFFRLAHNAGKRRKSTLDLIKQQAVIPETQAGVFRPLATRSDGTRV